MSKDFQDKRLVGRNCYLCSRGLKRSKVISFEKEAVINQFVGYLRDLGTPQHVIDKMLSNEDEFYQTALFNVYYVN